MLNKITQAEKRRDGQRHSHRIRNSYVAEEAYPLIPYVRGNEHPLAFGRTPRLLSILFTTFVNTQNADYNGKTRTLTIGKDVRASGPREWVC